MSERKRIYRDRDGIKRTMIWDDEDPDQVTVLSEQDIEPILDAVARDREIMAHNGPNKVLSHIPAIIWERAIHEGWDDDDWRRWYNGDGAAFRVWRGRV